MSKNGDIRGFFGQPSGRSSSQSLPIVNSSPPALAPQSSISTPRTPKSTSKPRDRTDEIKGSDDEDGDSDESLESISAFIERKHGPSPHIRTSTLTTTPKAKRIATASTTRLKSPLTIQPKHKFSFKQLLDHARQSDRAEESARRADELINQSDDDDDKFGKLLEEVQNDPSLLQKTAKELLDDDEEDTKGDKLMRAMNRTKVDGSRRVCYFFNLEQPLWKPLRKPFPQKKATGCWRHLADPKSRDQSFIFGYPHSIVSKGGKLPDEIFLWILDEVCVEKNAQLRVQYVNLVTWCIESIPRLVTTVRLYSMLEKIGGPNEFRRQDHTKAQSFPKVEDPYPGRNWTGLVTFLEILERMAPNLNTENVIGAIELLLRMALDPLVSTTVRSEHAEAMRALVKALPKDGTSQWDEACESISKYVYELVDGPSNQVTPINYMPNTSFKHLDLKRRMAAVVFFRDTSLARKPVDEGLTLDVLTNRLDSPDFVVSQTTDFEELRALIILLDIVLGCAGFIMKQYTNADGDEEKDASRKFDADIDGLTFRLKIIHDKIHDSTLLSRKVAKASIDLVAKRLTYAVRTRPPPKTSIFDSEPKEDKDLPKQREFMKSWAQKKAVSNGDSSTNGNGN